MPQKALEKFRRRTVQGFTGIIVLAELKNHSMNLADVLSFIHERFDVMLSPNTVRSMLRSLEQDGLVQKIWDKRKISYELAEKGKKDIKTITKKCAMDRPENCAYSFFFWTFTLLPMSLSFLSFQTGTNIPNKLTVSAFCVLHERCSQNFACACSKHLT